MARGVCGKRPEAYEMFAKGYSPKEVAEKTGVCYQTAGIFHRDWMKENLMTKDLDYFSKLYLWPEFPEEWTATTTMVLKGLRKRGKKE